MPRTGKIPQETLWALKRKIDIDSIPKKEKRKAIIDVANVFLVSYSTVYRQLRHLELDEEKHRADKGCIRVLPQEDMELYCDAIAAIKFRTKNKKGRCASTCTAIRILEQVGVKLKDSFVKAPEGLLNKTTVNRYLKILGLSDEIMSMEDIVTRFRATYSNEVWQFDLSVSDLKSIEQPPEWTRNNASKTQLMIYSVVDDRSGVAYQEYHCTSGEDVLVALRFLYNAMALKNDPRMPFQGMPNLIYMDNGPIGKSSLFQHVMKTLGIEIKYHYPRGKGGHKTSCRAKGKVERPFKTVKEMHETLYHFQKPQTEDEANQWLRNYLIHYARQKRRPEESTRIETWENNLPPAGYKEICSWERFATLARAPQDRKVRPDCIVSFDRVEYEVSPELAGLNVTVWIGAFDYDIYIDHEGQKYGPFGISNGVVPFNSFRKFKLTNAEKTKRRIEKLANEAEIPKEVFNYGLRIVKGDCDENKKNLPHRPFVDPDPFEQLRFSTELSARRYISRSLGRPLGSLEVEIAQLIDDLLHETLERDRIDATIATVCKRLG